ncbi:MAG: metallophosphoesterase [Burkholderiales bacterium]
MKLLILSDLHLEWAPYRLQEGTEFDAVVLAGDISQGPKAVAWAQRDSTFAGKPVLLVPGNHEFYGLERERTLEIMREQAQRSNVHVLDRDELVLTGAAGEHVRILGATLWTDFAVDGPPIAAAMEVARVGLNDFAGSIRQRQGHGQRRFTPEDSACEHELSRSWLAQRLAQPCPERSATVVVTHHGPSARSIVPAYEGDDLNPCFVSELPASFFELPQLWIHGHIHSSVDYCIGRTRVVTNPRGYRRRDSSFENGAFRPDLVIEVQP